MYCEFNSFCKHLLKKMKTYKNKIAKLIKRETENV